MDEWVYDDPASIPVNQVVDVTFDGSGWLDARWSGDAGSAGAGAHVSIWKYVGDGDSSYRS